MKAGQHSSRELIGRGVCYSPRDIYGKNIYYKYLCILLRLSLRIFYKGINQTQWKPSCSFLGLNILRSVQFVKVKSRISLCMYLR